MSTSDGPAAAPAAAAVGVEPVEPASVRSVTQTRKETVTDLFDLGKELGRGNFSKVVLGVSKADGKEYAVKIVNKSKLDTSKEKMQQEVEFLRMFDHPNIPKLYDVFEDDQKVYMVLELLRGGELFDTIVDRGQLTEEQARRICRQILEAVAYMHDGFKVVHRDLKPENIIFLAANDLDSPIKITDFGISRLFGSDQAMDVMKTHCGTIDYVAPEVLQDNEGGYSEKCDMWSVGVIVYIMLCGFPPFFSEVDNQNEVLQKIRLGAYGFPLPWWEDVSARAKDLISKLLVVNPNERLSPTEALNHEWVTQPAPEKTLQLNYSALSKKSKLKASLNAAWVCSTLMSGVGKRGSLLLAATKESKAQEAAEEAPASEAKA